MVIHLMWDSRTSGWYHVASISNDIWQVSSTIPQHQQVIWPGFVSWSYLESPCEDVADLGGASLGSCWSKRYSAGWVKNATWHLGNPRHIELLAISKISAIRVAATRHVAEGRPTSWNIATLIYDQTCHECVNPLFDHPLPKSYMLHMHIRIYELSYWFTWFN